ncbi:MAG TPA: hypothetical protein VGR71_08890, partial [Nitrospira sp.]|nr:hypothetical protein [Nitrospira sp.]
MMRDIFRTAFFLSMIAGASTLFGCGLTTTICSSVDGSCHTSVVTKDGVLYADEETGVYTSGPTIEQLSSSAEYRYPVRFDPVRAHQISRADAMAYLNKAVAVADRRYHLCRYGYDAISFTGVAQTTPYTQLFIFPVHGRILDQDNYVVFVRKLGPPLISN